MGLREVNRPEAQATIEAVTDVVACPFPKNRLSQVFAESSRLAVLFFLALSQCHSLVTQRLCNIGNLSAEARFGHFLLEMQLRLDPDENVLEIPLNQTLIGDALGMTSVHVSRVVSKLKSKELIEAKGSRMTIKDPDGLARLCEFNTDYLHANPGFLLD